VRNAVDLMGGRDLIVLRLEDAFDRSLWTCMQDVPEDNVHCPMKLAALPSDLSPKDHLVQLLQSLPTSSAVSSLVNQLSRLLLLFTAKRLHCSHLLLADSLTSLSVSLISSIASGDGLHVMNEREETWSSIQVLKPLGDVTSKECAAAFHWRQLHMVGHGNIENSYLGIRKVTRGV
jgi:cytoplasmic tRNA 2-thiolation protein 2